MTTREKIDLMRLGLESGVFPKVLYKYMRMDGVRAVLGDGTLKFSRRTKLNDVYECRGAVKAEYSVEDWKRHWIEDGRSEDEAKSLAEKIMGEPFEQARELEKAINSVTDSLGILCLTECKDNLLMWAHYADEHRGVCLEFCIEEDLYAFCFPKKVEYDSAYPQIDFLKDEKSATNVIFHKSEDWSYEKEYRVVRINTYTEESGEGTFTEGFNKNALVGIYFGCRCSDEEINEIKRTAVTNGFTHVRFYKMEVDSAMYKLNARSI